MTAFSIEALRSLVVRNATATFSGTTRTAPVRRGQIRRLEDMDARAHPEIVVVLEASPHEPTARVALVDPEPDQAIEWDLIVSIEGIAPDAVVEWVVMPDAVATVFTEQLISSKVLAEVPPNVLDYLRLLADPSGEDDLSLGAPPEGCRFGLIRTLPGDSLSRKRAQRASNLQALGEEAWVSGPIAAAVPSAELLNHFISDSNSWLDLVELARSARDLQGYFMGGNLLGNAAAKLIESLDPTAVRAMDTADFVHGLQVLSAAQPLADAPLDLTDHDLAQEALRALDPEGSVTVILLRAPHQKALVEKFSDVAHAQVHHLVTQLVGG